MDGPLIEFFPWKGSDAKAARVVGPPKNILDETALNIWDARSGHPVGEAPAFSPVTLPQGN